MTDIPDEAVRIVAHYIARHMGRTGGRPSQSEDVIARAALEAAAPALLAAERERIAAAIVTRGVQARDEEYDDDFDWPSFHAMTVGLDIAAKIARGEP